MTRLPLIGITLLILIAVPGMARTAALYGDTLDVHAIRNFDPGPLITFFRLTWPENILVPGSSVLKVDGQEVPPVTYHGDSQLYYEYLTRTDPDAPDEQYLISGAVVKFRPDGLVPGHVYKLEFETDRSGTPIRVTRYIRALPPENRICRARVRADSALMGSPGGQMAMGRRFRIEKVWDLDRTLYSLFPRSMEDSPDARLVFTTKGFDSTQDEYPNSHFNINPAAMGGEGILIQTQVLDTLAYWTFVGEQYCAMPDSEAPFSRDSALRVLQRAYPPGSEGNPFPDPLHLGPLFKAEGADRPLTACYEGGAWHARRGWVLPQPWEDIWNIRILEYTVEANGAAAFSLRKDTTFPVNRIIETDRGTPGNGRVTPFDALGRKASRMLRSPALHWPMGGKR